MLRLMTVVLLIVVGLSTTDAIADKNRPFRGKIGLSVLLCQFSDTQQVAYTKQHYEDMFVTPFTNALADYWREVSNGSVLVEGVVKGWYTLNITQADAIAFGGGGSPNRTKKFTICVDQAKAEGYTPPEDHLVAVINSPTIDTFGMTGGFLLGEDVGVTVAAHEMGHGLALRHSYSDDPTECNANWASVGEYDDQWDLMSATNVYSIPLAAYGWGGPWLNAYHIDRLGWLESSRILRFGADRDYDKEVTLTALSRPDDSGYMMARVPFDAQDLNRYYTVEYRIPEEWDGGIGADRVLIHEVKAERKTRCSDGTLGDRTDYNAYLIRDHVGARNPKESIDLNGVRIDVISKNPSTGKAQVRIRSTKPDHCLQGYVWREAGASDHVCTSAQRRDAVAEENRLADSRKLPGNTRCKQGFVWREAYRGDRVCVIPASRSQAADENRRANQRRIGSAAYGPNTCKTGYVWREADEKDWVCVVAQRRAEVSEENRLADSRRQPGGGSYGEDTCKQGYVWRDAFPGDHVCVTAVSRAKVAEENEKAYDRLANQGS